MRLVLGGWRHTPVLSQLLWAPHLGLALLEPLREVSQQGLWWVASTARNSLGYIHLVEPYLLESIVALVAEKRGSIHMNRVREISWRSEFKLGFAMKEVHVGRQGTETFLVESAPNMQKQQWAKLFGDWWKKKKYWNGRIKNGKVALRRKKSLRFILKKRLWLFGGLEWKPEWSVV